MGGLLYVNSWKSQLQSNMIIAVFEVAFAFVGRGFLVGVGAQIFLTPPGASLTTPASSLVSLGPDWRSDSRVP